MERLPVVPQDPDGACGDFQNRVPRLIAQASKRFGLSFNRPEMTLDSLKAKDRVYPAPTLQAVLLCRPAVLLTSSSQRTCTPARTAGGPKQITISRSSIVVSPGRA
jgi:hypothetical protein